MTKQITLHEVIKSHSDLLQDNIYTSLPATVTSYNASKQSVDVNIDLRCTNPSSGEDFGAMSLRELPVMFPSGGGGILSFPVKAGDKVLVQFSKFSLDAWLEGGEGVVPDNRQHDINDAIAIIGLNNLKTNLSPNAEDMELKFNGTTITLKAGGDVEITPSGKTVINSNLDVNGDILATGKITGEKVIDSATNNTLSTHTHPSNGAPPTGGT